jgi:hypothetical protein
MITVQVVNTSQSRSGTAFITSLPLYAPVCGYPFCNGQSFRINRLVHTIWLAGESLSGAIYLPDNIFFCFVVGIVCPMLGICGLLKDGIHLFI